MFGFACDETPALMPLPIALAHGLCHAHGRGAEGGCDPLPGPDGKSQVTVEYRDGRPARAAAVVIAQQHLKGLVESRLRQEIIEKVIRPVCGAYFDARPGAGERLGELHRRRPRGGHGRHGPQDRRRHLRRHGPHGGGAISGKDPTKVDRSGTYAAR